jgi:hypothetical protein
MEEDSPDTHEFIRRYKEWRGLACIDLPFSSLGRTFHICFDNPSEANYWANLFNYVPFSSTEDRMGEVAINSINFQPPLYPNFTITNLTVSNIVNADLFFPHMEESDDLGEVLQQTYAPLGAELYNMTDATFIPSSPYCDYTTIRTNPGDDLFAGELSADVVYDAEFSCTFMLPGEGRLCEAKGGVCRTYVTDAHECVIKYGPVDCRYESPYDINPAPGGACVVEPCTVPNFRSCLQNAPADGVCVPRNWTCETWYDTSPGYCPRDGFYCGADCEQEITEFPDHTESCSVEIFVTINLETRTPLADRVWARLVAGTMSVFRRIFPKVDEGGAVEEIWDIPTATGVSYIDRSNPPGIIFAGDPRYRIPGSNASLFFPHIGGIREYFMTGIQTILRPKGYGDQILSNVIRVPTPPPGTYPPPGSSSGTGSCDIYARATAEPPFPVGGNRLGCQPPVAGWCSVGTLQELAGFNAETARQAAMICLRESGGWPNALNDCCITGRTCDFSIGLFQINALPGRCDPSYNSRYPYEVAFRGNATGGSCTQAGDWFCSWYPTVTACCMPTSEAAAYQCIEYWSDPRINIEKMINMHRDNGWCPWRMGSGTLSWCGIDFSSCY